MHMDKEKAGMIVYPVAYPYHGPKLASYNDAHRPIK